VKVSISIAVIFISFSISCNTYENKMNNLLSQKKLLEDSIKNDIDKSKNKYGRIPIDSLGNIIERNIVRNEELDKIIYSIDSLSKLK
jgi:hypothetical protein